jgi:hypothetical protein
VESRTQLQVDIFGGFRLPEIPKQNLNDPDAGTNAAREADEATSRLIEVNMPLGIAFEEKGGGDIYIKEVDEASDAFAQGVRPGAQLVMVSATFGDDMWNARGVGMTQLNTVIKSRFGATIKLALEKENESFLDNFFGAFKKASDPEAEAKMEAKMTSVFDEEEEKLKDKNMWNPFR